MNVEIHIQSKLINALELFYIVSSSWLMYVDNGTLQ